MDSIDSNTPATNPANDDSTGSGGVGDLMHLTRTYLAEKPTSKTDTADRLGLVMGHFFMALMPRATQHSILTVTGYCLSQLALHQLEEHNARQKSARKPASRKPTARKASVQ